jgi:hypothetical protein
VILLKVRPHKGPLGHVDATLKQLDPSCDAGTVKPKLLPRNIALFHQGELGGLILGAVHL